MYINLFQDSKEAKVEAESEKNQGPYNLRRRKTDGEAKPAEAKPEVVEKAQEAAAPAAVLSTPLDFGGKIGRRSCTLMSVLS